MKISKLMIGFLIVIMLVLTACQSSQPAVKPVDQREPVQQEMKVYKIGFIAPLTGDAANYGLSQQRVVEDAVSSVNKKLVSKNLKIEVIYEDGKCSGKESLIAAQKLVNQDGVKIIQGGFCSSETLGIAPFAEQNKILLFSSSSSSPAITNSGDYIFRNYPSDVAQVYQAMEFVKAKGWKKAAILTESVDYAEALRKKYKDEFEKAGIELVADEVFVPGAKDVKTEIIKIKSTSPDFAVYLINTAGEVAKQSTELNVNYPVIGSDTWGIKDTLDPYVDYMQGYYIVQSYFDKENDPAFIQMTKNDDCGLGYYCATGYDAITLLGEMLEICGENNDCIRDNLYQTKNWNGVYVNDVTFDSNGDASGSFKVRQVSGKELVDIN